MNDNLIELATQIFNNWKHQDYKLQLDNGQIINLTPNQIDGLMCQIWYNQLAARIITNVVLHYKGNLPDDKTLNTIIDRVFQKVDAEIINRIDNFNQFLIQDKLVTNPLSVAILSPQIIDLYLNQIDAELNVQAKARLPDIIDNGNTDIATWAKAFVDNIVQNKTKGQ